jgi:hypothetical protein
MDMLQTITKTLIPLSEVKPHSHVLYNETLFIIIVIPSNYIIGTPNTIAVIRVRKQRVIRKTAIPAETPKNHREKKFRRSYVPGENIIYESVDTSLPDQPEFLGVDSIVELIAA